MKHKRSKAKSLIALLLSVIMIISLTPGVPIKAAGAIGKLNGQSYSSIEALVSVSNGAIFPSE